MSNIFKNGSSFPKLSSFKTSKRIFTRRSYRGDTLMTSMIFLFVLIGSLRLCNTKTLHEAKLTGIFVQETQGFYLLENLMHLARDYAYQIVQNPREPHLFLSASAYRTKDKTGLKDDAENKDKWIIDFNGSLSKEQIVPEDFPLQIKDDGWEIRGGPIFWKDNKKNAYDKRYLSEVFMLGSLQLISTFIPDWTMRTVQTMEIERNPLCDFQLYAEGDTALTTNIHDTDWEITINGPVQINGNVRFSASNGVANNNLIFTNKFNSAGYVLYVDGNDTLKNFKLPAKYHILDNSGNYKKTYGNGSNGFYFNRYAINYGSTSTYRLSASYNNFIDNVVTFSDMYQDGYNKNNYESYERCVFNLYRGNFTTRSRIYRPIGFDPENYWGFWDPNLGVPGVSSGAGETVDPDHHIVNFCFGFHGLAQSSNMGACANSIHSDTDPGTCSSRNSMQTLRGLTPYQISEKARLVEMQKPINFNMVLLDLLPEPINKNSPFFYIPNNFIYSTYLSNAFPATKDNLHLNRYLNIAFQSTSLLFFYRFWYYYTTETKFAYDYDEFPSMDALCYMDISQNKSAFNVLTSQNINPNPQLSINSNQSFATITSTFTPTGHGDDSCPPDKIIDCGSYWYLDNYVTRVTGNHYHFMYDHNRAKWIQLLDIDVGKLKTQMESLDLWNDGTVSPILDINSYFQGIDAFYTNKNYIRDGVDIRYNYANRRTSFFASYANGSYVYPNNNKPVIDVGVRLINARTLPNKGLTIYSPYPIYIKGNFNDLSQKPALIITDSITFLPDSWQDWRSQMDFAQTHLWYDTSDQTYKCSPENVYGTTIYADIITGRTHPHFWIQTADTTTGTNQTQVPNPDMGFHDGFRSLTGMYKALKLYGSLMLPYFCQEQWEPPINFARHWGRDPLNYSYPYLDMHPRVNAGIPVAMPVYYRINRGRKTHCLGDAAYTTLMGDTLYNKDWTTSGANFTFSKYHDTLPNYLRYEVAP